MKFSGKIGFWDEDIETSPGIYKPDIVERPYFGEVSRNNRSFQTGSSQNDEFQINNQISIISDLYAQQNWASIRYVLWNGVKWKVRSVVVEYPRLTLEIGGFWNGEEKDETDTPPEIDEPFGGV